MVTGASGPSLFSSAYCSFAPSRMRRLTASAARCDRDLDLAVAGSSIPARTAMMTTAAAIGASHRGSCHFGAASSLGATTLNHPRTFCRRSSDSRGAAGSLAGAAEAAIASRRSGMVALMRSCNRLSSGSCARARRTSASSAGVSSPRSSAVRRASSRSRENCGESGFMGRGRCGRVRTPGSSRHDEADNQRGRWSARSGR